MLSPALQRDNRLRWAGFSLDSHTTSGRRWWRLGDGVLLYDDWQADSLLDALIEADFRPCGERGWSRMERTDDIVWQTFVSTRGALDILKQETLARIRAMSK